MARTWPADWNERMRGVDCGMCREGRPEELKGGSRIFAGQVSDAYLRREGWVRGYSVVIWRGRHASELHDLVSDELARYWSEVSRVGRALADHFRPAKLNYEVLGNSVPHVHTHIVPRYLDDPAPGRPLPFPDPRLPDQPEERFQRDVASLRQILGHDPSGPDGRRSEIQRAGSPTAASGQIATLLDLTRDLMEGLKKEIEPLDVEQLRWQPDPRANSIGVTVWHVARWLDTLAHRRLRGLDAADEIWLRDGWAERTGYDPRGVGLRGWGVVTGYTIEEVARIRPIRAFMLPTLLDRISLRVEREHLILPVRALLYARRDNGVTTLQLEDQVLRARLSLNRLEGLLVPFGFFRSHRAFLVNLRRVRRIVPWSEDAASLLLDDPGETMVPLAKSRRTLLRAALLWP